MAVGKNYLFLKANTFIYSINKKELEKNGDIKPVDSIECKGTANLCAYDDNVLAVTQEREEPFPSIKLYGVDERGSRLLTHMYPEYIALPGTTFLAVNSNGLFAFYDGINPRINLCQINQKSK